jgi:hypothetical protein
MISPQEQYVPLPKNEDADELFVNHPKTLTSSTLTIVILSITSAILAVALSISIGLSLQPTLVSTPQTPPDLPRLSCGHSMAEAEANGCHWDALSKSWLPEPCPQNYNQAFLARAHDWSYWADKNATAVIPDISILADETVNAQPWYTTEAEHAAHCAFLVLRNVHALTYGTRINRISGQYEHVEHCMYFLLNISRSSPTRDVVGVRGYSLFGWC